MGDFVAKPTNNKPVSDLSKNYEKNFNKTMKMNGLNINEVDELLTEREVSLKKKIFSLPKMEALVHPDPRLSAIYNKMAEDGEEKYGYHHNETIMNIIFNDYILNSPKYLQKYKMAVPKKKKRRDKSGIRQLQKAGEKKITQSRRDDKKTIKPADDLEETSTTGSVGGSGMGSGGYVTPHAWGSGDLSGGMKKQKIPIQKKAIWNGGTIISENNYLIEASGFEKYYNLLNENDIDFINKNAEGYGNLENMGQNDIDIIKTDIKTKHLDEKSKSKAQQRFMGMVHGVQRGNISPQDIGGNVKRVADKMKPSDVKDFANTKHDKLPEKINKPTLTMKNVVTENHLNSKEDKVMYIIKANNVINPNDTFDISILPYMKNYFMSLGDEQVNELYKTSERLVQKKGIDPMSIDINENSMNEHHLTDRKSQINWIIAADDMIFNAKNANRLLKILNSENVSDDKVNNLYLKYEKMATQMGIDPMRINVNEETDQTMIGGNTESIANKPRPEGEFGGGIPMGMQDSGGLRESNDEIDNLDNEFDFNSNDEQSPKYDDSELFEKLNEELKAFVIHHSKLKSIMEDKKHPSMVNLERKRSENEGNSKSHRKNSLINDVIKMENDIAWKDQQTNVNKNPYKTGEDLEKASIKSTQGNALKNVGDSDGTNDEIPKRNLTPKEQDEIDEYRLGQQDLVYDSPPSKKFEERMKAGMGDKMYKKRQENLKKRSEYPMYNKERQPVQNTEIKKVEFNKEKSGWNEREGIRESVFTGKYVNEIDKTKIIDFKLKNVKIVESANDMFSIDFAGMGNSIDSRGNINEAIDNLILKYRFYTNGKAIVAIKNSVQKLNESANTKKLVENEDISKMKHLLGYDSKKFIDSKRSKL